MKYCVSYEFDGPLVQNVYFNLLTSLAIISPILFVYTGHCIIYQSPKMAKSYRWYLLAHQISAEIACAYLHTIARPLTFTPKTLLAVTGILRYVVSARYFLPIGVLLVNTNIVTILQLFGYRYYFISETNLTPSARIFRKINTAAVILGYVIGIFQFASVEYIASLRPNITQEYIANYTCIQELTKFDIELYGYDAEEMAKYFAFPETINIILTFALFAYFIIINRRSFQGTSMSPQLMKMHRNYMKQLIYQTSMPFVILFIPAFFMLLILFGEIEGQTFILNSMILSCATFSIIDSAVLITMNKPYRIWIVQKIGGLLFKNNRTTPTNTQLRPKSNQQVNT